MRFVLHIGAHKTGTTTIQEFCAHHRDALKARGLIYPDLSAVGSRSSVSHHDLAAAFSSSPRRKITADGMENFLTGLAQAAGDQDTVLLSAESIYRHVLSEGKITGFWKDHQAYLKRLAKFFAPYQTEIVVVFRRYDTFAESLFQENVKSKGYAKPFKVFAKDYSHFWAYRRRVELLRKVFDKVTVLSFERLSQEDLTAAFLRSVGVDAGALAPIERKNSGLPTQLVLFLQEMNARLDKQERNALSTQLTELDSDFLSSFERIGLFAAKERQAFLKRHAADNRWLGQTLTGSDAFFELPITPKDGRASLTRDERHRIMGRLPEPEPQAAPEPPESLLRRLASGLKRQRG